MIRISTAKKQIRDLGIMMSNTDTFTQHIRNIFKKVRNKMRCDESVPFAAALSHDDTLEVSCHSYDKGAAVSSGIHVRKQAYKLSKLLNDRLQTKSLKYST